MLGPVVSVSVRVVSAPELGGGVAPSWKGVCGAELKKKGGGGWGEPSEGARAAEF